MKSNQRNTVRKHRGNPHGNPPGHKNPRRETSDDNLGQSVKPGVSQSKRLKQ